MKISIELTFNEIVDLIRHNPMFDGREIQSIEPVIVPKDCDSADIGGNFQEIQTVIFRLGEKKQVKYGPTDR